MSAKHILDSGFNNCIKERLLKINLSAYKPVKSLIKLGVIKKECSNCNMELYNAIHVFFNCYAAKYSIMLIQNVIFFNWKITFQITPDMLLVTCLDKLKNVKALQNIKMGIINLILAYKNLTHLDFYSKKLIVKPTSTIYHTKLIRRVVNLTLKSSKGKGIRIIVPPKPIKMPNGDNFPSLLDLLGSEMYFTASGLPVPRSQLNCVGEIKIPLFNNEELSELLTNLRKLSPLKPLDSSSTPVSS